jgi:hypothetical protein
MLAGRLEGGEAGQCAVRRVTQVVAGLRLRGAQQQRDAGPAGGLPAHGDEDRQGQRVREGHPGQIDQQRLGLLGQALEQPHPQVRDVAQAEVAGELRDQPAPVVPHLAGDRHCYRPPELGTE